jgi:hypothetical protein
MGPLRDYVWLIKFSCVTLSVMLIRLQPLKNGTILKRKSDNYKALQKTAQIDRFVT